MWDEETHTFLSILGPVPESRSLWSHVLPWEEVLTKEREGTVPTSGVKAEGRDQEESQLSHYLSKRVRNTDQESKQYYFLRFPKSYGCVYFISPIY